MLVLETILRRWYAFAFIGAFFWAATAERDWKRALRFLATAALISWCAEYMSTHTPFPYGRYRYVAHSRGDELYLANIPAFVPLSFGVVVWAGRSLAQAGLKARTAGRVILGGALMATVLDLIIDPMTLRAHQWFMDDLYQFEAGGDWFGVPWSNYGGWLLVSAAILWVDEIFETHNARAIDPIRGVTLAGGISGFFILLALLTRNWAIAFGSLAVALVVFGIVRGNVAALLGEQGRLDGEAEAAP